MGNALHKRTVDLLTSIGRNERRALSLLALVLAGIWLFVALADEVMEGETHALDAAILLWLRNPVDPSDPLGPHWLEEMGRDFTALGGVGVLTLFTVLVLGYLLLRRLPGAALLVLASVGGGLLLSTVLKMGFDRPRPELVSHGSYVYTASFPSGHSMLAAIVYLTLGALLARVQPQWRLKAYLLLCALLLTVLVGVSRVYLGVHWPTDVLAGWTIGAAWALLCWLVAYGLQQRGKVETGNGQATGP